MKITATIVYAVNVEVDVSARSLKTEKGKEEAREKLLSEAKLAVSEGMIDPVIHECSRADLID